MDSKTLVVVSAVLGVLVLMSVGAGVWFIVFGEDNPEAKQAKAENARQRQAKATVRPSRINMDRPTTPRFWLYVLGVAAAIAVGIFAIYASNESNEFVENVEDIQRQQEQNEDEFRERLRDACIQNPGQCGAG